MKVWVNEVTMMELIHKACPKKSLDGCQDWVWVQLGYPRLMKGVSFGADH